MKFTRGLHAHVPTSEPCVATIGNFDGLHLGHQQLFSRLREKAKTLGLPLVVISFEPLPAEYFMTKPPARIYPLRDKIRLMQSLGVDHFVCLRFDEALATQSAEAFVKTILDESLKVRFLAVGDDFRFGFKRQGDFKLLQEMGRQFGMEVSDTPTCELDDQRVSSTRIRHHLEAGDLAAANRLLGHKYQLSGRVRHGDKRGRTIGFPTLNMKMLGHIAPARGVYAVKIRGLDESVYRGVANLGARPTVRGTQNRLETHVFDYAADAYGRYVCVELVKFLRPEQRFSDFETLKQQIGRDVEQAHQQFSD